MRQIKQLGPCHWVYPTAVHTRFDHSLGALEMAVRMIRAIRGNGDSAEDERAISPEEECLARLFALFHDIGHTPFGHILEDEFPILPRHDHDPGRIERFLGTDSPIGRIVRQDLGAELHGRLLDLFFAAAGATETVGGDGFILDLITNSVCADLLDYLRRDAFFCNIGLDADYRFLRHLSIAQVCGRRRLAIRLWKQGKGAPRRDVLNELIRLLDNRYLMGERVYFHHAKLIAGTMVASAVARARRAGEIADECLHAIGDDVLLHLLRQCREPAARRLAERLAERRLWKRIYERSRGAMAADQQALRSVNLASALRRRFHDSPSRLIDEEDRLGGMLGLGPGDLLIHCPHPNMASKLADCLVYWNGEPRPLKDCADDELVGSRLASILAAHRNLWAFRAFLNPDRIDARDRAADALDCALCYEPSRARRLARAFGEPLLREIVRQNRCGQTMAAEQADARLEQALARFSETSEPKRTREDAEAIARWAFLGGESDGA
ncbi:MAG: Deoxyguanosinetriphosphate triphosphohydrolase-like protein [candidate division BRC1 bacterium ADurb.BinA364]|nr:MAG: Deoxyguanosinetriphosphate triphosphohydrolase-like protein [candidate division BRC1 bacterium ADurb.BinA364]